MADLDVKIDADGAILAKRRDGLPLTIEDKEKAKAAPVSAPRAWVVEEIRGDDRLRAFKVCSAPLQAHLWVVLDSTFDHRDDLAVFYPHELEFLKDKDPQTLCEIQQVKLTFPGSKVRQ